MNVFLGITSYFLINRKPAEVSNRISDTIQSEKFWFTSVLRNVLLQDLFACTWRKPIYFLYLCNAHCFFCCHKPWIQENKISDFFIVKSILNINLSTISIINFLHSYLDTKTTFSIICFLFSTLSVIYQLNATTDI